jgi:hypothetical protein
MTHENQNTKSLTRARQYGLRIAHFASRLISYWDSFLLFLAFLTLYVITLSPGLQPADSGEFQVVVPLLGVAHPPGFSLYILLGKLFISLVRVGDYAYRLNLFSAFTSALTLVLVNLSIKRLIVGQQSPTDSRWARSLSTLASLLPTILLGLSTTFWSQATTTNIRSLMALLTALAVYALSQYRLTPAPNRLAFFLFSVSLAVVHHLSIAFIALILILSVLQFSPAPLLPFLRKNFFKLTAAALAPFLILLYLPIRGAQGAYLAPPGLDTLNGFLQHALGLGFGGDFFYFANPIYWPDRFAILLNIFQFQFNDLTLLLLALGLILLFFKDWKLATTLALAFAVHCFIAITYRAPQTVEYLLPAYVILVVASGVGLKGILDFRFWILDRSFVRHLSFVICHLSFAIASLFVFFRNYPAYFALSKDNSLHDSIVDALTSANPQALILSNWHYATAFWYVQNFEGLRLDVDVEYVFPQGESLAQNWVDRINANVPQRPTLVTNLYPTEYAATPYRFLPILTAFPVWQASPDPLTDPEVTTATHEGGWTFVTGGPILNNSDNTLTQNQAFLVQTFWRAPEKPTDINFFVQLIGPDGLLYGQADVFHPASKLSPHEIISDRLPLAVNANAPIATNYSLVVGAYLPNGQRLAPDITQILKLTVMPSPTPPATLNPQSFGLLSGYDFDFSIPESPRLYLHWRLDGQTHSLTLNDQPISLPALTGYITTSHDLSPDSNILTLTENNSQLLQFSNPSSLHSSLPTYISFGPLVLVGSTINKEPDGTYRVDLDWLANQPITQDLVIKVDLVGENYSWRDQSDSIPAGGAIPTLKWIPGIIIHDRHRLTPQQPGPAPFQLAVYDHFTQRNLPILDSHLAQLGPTVQLGSTLP